MDLVSASAEAATANQEQLTLDLGLAQDALESAAVAYNTANQNGTDYVGALKSLGDRRQLREGGNRSRRVAKTVERSCGGGPGPEHDAQQFVGRPQSAWAQALFPSWRISSNGSRR